VSRPASEQDKEPWWETYPRVPWPGAHVVEQVVTNRVFLLGLDELYRDAMKRHERGELLACARRVATTLGSSAPCRTSRSNGRPPSRPCPSSSRLLAVTSSLIFGSPMRQYLLPLSRDPLSASLLQAQSPEEWTVPLLTARASTIARDTDDCSLVGLAARAEDAVALTALAGVGRRVRGAARFAGCRDAKLAKIRRQVDPDLCAAAQRFVDTFNSLFGRELPPATQKYAHAFARAKEYEIVGRCVRLGQTPEQQPRYYHWAIVMDAAARRLGVREFWAPTIWTTERYRRDGNMDRRVVEHIDGVPSKLT